MKSKTDKFFNDLANNTPNDKQFKFKKKKKVNKKKHKRKPLLKEPDTGWSGIV